MRGIQAYGAYAPRMRLQRQAIHEANAWLAPGLAGLASGERAIANWDEDVVTMAVEAARDCLGDLNRSTLRGLILASTSFPFLDRQNAGIVKEALNMPDAVSTLDVGQSGKAGVAALVQAFHAGGSDPILVGASEQKRNPPASEGEMINGDGAAFFVVGPGAGVARLLGSHSLSVDFVDHFRAEGMPYDYGWEARWVREEGYAALAGKALTDALAAMTIEPQDVSHFIAGVPAKGVAAGLAKKAGIRPSAVRDDLYNVLGNAGCAHPLIMLAHALETAKAGEKLLVLGFGQGAEVLALEATGAPQPAGDRKGVSGHLARARKERNYIKFLAFTGALKPELGKRAEFDQKPVLTALYRNRKSVLGLVGIRNSRTGDVQYPRSEISVHSASPEDVQEDYPLAEKRARIITFTADNLTFTLDPPCYYGTVEFEGGGRMTAEFTDVEPHQISVGAPMRMMFRIKAIDSRSGFRKYFWKAVPAAGSN